MAVTWPSTLPQKFEQDGYSEKNKDLYVMTDMDVGPPKRRRRYTYGYHPISGTMIMTPAQKTIFKNFYAASGAGQFTFPDPDSESTVEVMFSSEVPEYIPYAGEYWQVTISLMVLP